MPETSSPPISTQLDVFRAYEGQDAPLPQYAALVAIFSTFALALLAAENRRRPAAKPLGVGDVLLLGVATHKLSRLVTKDRVTSPFRAPFARLVGSAGAGEVEEDARGRGLQKAIGDLVTCPFCASPWAALALTAALRIAPRAGRMICGILSSVTLAHFLHHAHVLLEEKKK